VGGKIFKAISFRRYYPLYTVKKHIEKYSFANLLQQKYTCTITGTTY